MIKRCKDLRMFGCTLDLYVVNMTPLATSASGLLGNKCVRVRECEEKF